MARNMMYFWLSLLLSVIGSDAAGELSILYHPDSLQFTGQGSVRESDLKEVFSAALGLSVEERAEWSGLSVTDPFNTPEAAVIVKIDGIPNLSYLGLKRASYPVAVDTLNPDIFHAVEHRIRQRYTSGGNKLVNLAFEGIAKDPSKIFKDLKMFQKPSVTHLSKDVPVDKSFINEIEVMNAVASKIETSAFPDNLVDLFYFRVQTLHALLDMHGHHSVQAKEARHLLVKALENLSNAFNKAYDGSVLVAAVTTDVAHTRSRVIRAAQAEGENPPAKDETPAPDDKPANKDDDGYGDDYGAIFNIILWFGVVFVFTLVAITYAMIDMDPGRDSIIYRMTSTRIKKDN